MREFFRSRFFKVVMVVLALLLGFMIYAISQKGVGVVTSQIVGAISAPFQKLSSYISETATDFFGKFVNAQEYYEQNQQLREEIAKLREDMVDYDKIKRENEQLKELAGLKEKDSNIQMVAATVVARDPSERFGSFTIDKGALHGIKVRDTVITAEGLVGVVTEVGEVYSKVTTILSPELKIGAMEQRTGEIGIVTGTVALSEENSCKLSNLGTDSQIKEGDLIVTSGAGGIYPKGVVIGKAGAIQIEEHGITSYAKVTPVFEIKAVKQVFVITDFFGKSQGGED
jgi:rod shape-determining protein MreC